MRQMKLGLNLVGNGAHGGGWRMPGAHLGSSMDFALWKRLAQQAEAAKFHFMFRADGIAVRSSARDETQLSYDSRIDVFEPFTIMAALSAVTEQMGFIASASTTSNEPYHIARKFASLDHISGGRSGWNVVTSWSEQEAQNFGHDRLLDHALRYKRAEEFVDVVLALWDSWEDEAFIRDKASGQYFDPAGLHTPHHRGAHFSVRGPLNVARPVQGHPAIAQAGSSGPGQALGARHADIIYTMQKFLADAQAFYASVKGHVVAQGRAPESALVMPGIMPIMGRTRAEALIHPELGLAALAPSFGDLGGHPLDGPVPPPLAETNSVKSAHERLARELEGRTITIRELIDQRAASGHHVFIGTPASIADEMEDWFTRRGCDGWNILPPFLPGPVEDVFKRLIPELQRRGLFQTEYAGRTFRDNLGLARPAHPVMRAAAAE